MIDMAKVRQIAAACAGLSPEEVAEAIAKSKLAAKGDPKKLAELLCSLNG